MIADDFLDLSAQWYENEQEDLVSLNHAKQAVAMAKNEMKERAIELFRKRCPQLQDDDICGYSKYYYGRVGGFTLKCDRECSLLKNIKKQLENE